MEITEFSNAVGCGVSQKEEGEKPKTRHRPPREGTGWSGLGQGGVEWGGAEWSGSGGRGSQRSGRFFPTRKAADVELSVVVGPGPGPRAGPAELSIFQGGLVLRMDPLCLWGFFFSRLVPTAQTVQRVQSKRLGTRAWVLEYQGNYGVVTECANGCPPPNG